MNLDNAARSRPQATNPDLAWSVPVMRAGYIGRGLVYLIVAGFSLYAMWLGGQAQGVSPALRQLETSNWGAVILVLILLGTVAFAIWSFAASYYDLDDRGSETRGIAIRLGMVGAGLVSLAIGWLAFWLLFAESASAAGVMGAAGAGDESSIERGIAAVMRWPGGRWLVGISGLAVIGAGIGFMVNGWNEEYRVYLRANRFTRDWNWALKAGVIARGAVIGVIGVLFVLAAWRAHPGQAGGIGRAFSWLTHQPYGQALVVAICLGLLGYALFCFVNAAYRIVPKVAGGDVETLASRLKATVGLAT